MKSRIIILSRLLAAMIFFMAFSCQAFASDEKQGINLPENKKSSTIMIQVSHSRLIKSRRPVIRASIADPEIADVNMITPNQILVIANGDKAGSTTLILWQDENQIETFDVHIYTAISPVLLNLLKTRINKIAPSIEIGVMPTIDKPDNGTILLTGMVASQKLLNKVLLVVESFNIKYYNLIDITGPQQVQLKVVIAEISKSGLKQMGINFLSSAFGFSKGGTVEGETEFTNSTGTKPKSVLNLLTGELTSHIINDNWTNTTTTSGHTITSPFASAFQIAVNSSGNNWLALISLLKNQGLSKFLATPTLVTMNGQTAEFQVGGSYPIPVQTDEGGITIEQVSYGIILSFTPYILDDETITLEVAPEVSTPDFSLGVTSGGVTVPGLATRKATTTLQLKDGQTFAMAGLLREESYVTINKVPFLGDIPYLGALFTSKETKHTETELVILVTPKIVRPLNKNEIPVLPGEETGNKISDIDFFIKNKLDLPQKNKEANNKFQGSTGFSK